MHKEKFFVCNLFDELVTFSDSQNTKNSEINFKLFKHSYVLISIFFLILRPNCDLENIYIQTTLIINLNFCFNVNIKQIIINTILEYI